MHLSGTLNISCNHGHVDFLIQNLPKKDTGKEEQRLEDGAPPLVDPLGMEEIENFAAKSLAVKSGLIGIVADTTYLKYLKVDVPPDSCICQLLML